MSKGATKEAIRAGYGMMNRYRDIEDTLASQLQSILGTPVGGGSSILPAVISGLSLIFHHPSGLRSF